MFFSCTKYSLEKEYKVIAHRGYWNTDGSADNSLSSLKKALSLGVDGVELDVCVTEDDSLLVIHGPKHGNLLISDATYAELRQIRLSNGELVPTLHEYLSCVKTNNEISLFIELKSPRLVSEVLKKIQIFGIEHQVYYISFMLSVCQELVALNSSLKVLYLGGDVEPEKLKVLGLTGFSYNIDILKKHSDWVRRAIENGLTTNAWVIKYESELIWCATHHIDFLTTDMPAEAKSFLSEYD